MDIKKGEEEQEIVDFGLHYEKLEVENSRINKLIRNYRARVKRIKEKKWLKSRKEPTRR